MANEPNKVEAQGTNTRSANGQQIDVNQNRPRRYTTLEGMRGIGAIYVVLTHGTLLFGFASPGSAHLGVDFFFVLSGFIVAHVYAGPLDRGLSVATFLRGRLLRLYPVYLLGALIGAALAARSLLIGHSSALWDYTHPLISLPFALLLLPSPMSDAMFPLDIPAWSLFVEFIINIGFAVRCLRSTRALFACMMVSGVVLMIALLTEDSLNFGWNKATAALGFARICFSFPLGVFIYRFHGAIRAPSWFFIVPLIAFSTLLYANPTGSYRVAFDLTFIFVISPALVLAGAACNTTNAKLEGVFIGLGATSYPLYALHYPALMAIIGMISRHVPPGPATTVFAVATLGGMIWGAKWVAVLDARLRSRLTQRVSRSTIRAGIVGA